MNPVEIRWQIAVDAYIDDDYRLANSLFRRLAMEGHAASMFYLAQIHQLGLGVPKNSEMALRWYMAAAERNEREALCQMGTFYRLGEGVPVDKVAAIRCYRLSAQMGDKDAQYELGWCYEHGDGVEVDIGRALHWYTLSSAQWHSEARTRLITLLCRSIAQRA